MSVIKGVNRRIIEVINPDDHYFEKVILFLSPDATEDPQASKDRVEKYVNDVSQQFFFHNPIGKQKGKIRFYQKSSQRRFLFWIQMLSALCVGGGVMFFMRSLNIW